MCQLSMNCPVLKPSHQHPLVMHAFSSMFRAPAVALVLISVCEVSTTVVCIAWPVPSAQIGDPSVGLRLVRKVACIAFSAVVATLHTN